MTDVKTQKTADLLITDAAQVLTCIPAIDDPIGRRDGVNIAICGEHIAAVGSPAEVSRQVDVSSAQVIDAAGKIIAPGFVDCHTHVVFGGSRASEYAARMTLTAAETAKLDIPTGIQATVYMTRSASADELYRDAADRLMRMFQCGTTTVESKSGYGLTLNKEIEQLKVGRRLQESTPLDVVNTFLGAHDFPREIPREQYIESLIHEMIPRIGEENLAAFCDVYCDDGYYTIDESRQILEAGLLAGMNPKIHVDAYADIGGGLMSAEIPVVSADHLNYTPVKTAYAMAQAGVIGVVMPALDFAVAHPRPFDARMLMDAGLPLALATDICPGCWTESMQVVMQLACRLYHFSPEEALLASTYTAARSIGLKDRGTLEAGKLADIQIWDLPGLDDLIYRIGNNSVKMVIKRGKIYHIKEDIND
ncbi:MAG: imidazolonepropionase [Anaerolineaceae bacterium]|nr:imidazolonepropionase [Anaerolineaceae bacterium]